MRRTTAILVAAGLMVPIAARAMDEQVWLMLHGGAGTYVMSDLNVEMDALNATTGLNFPHVEDGRLLGGSMGFETAGRWNIGLGMDRLDASTRAGDATGAIEFRLGANAWRLFAEYALRPIGQSTVFVGGAVGILQENGKFIVSQSGLAPASFKLSGSDPLYEGYVGGNWWATPRVALTTTVGYRRARVNEVKIEGDTFIMSNGEAMSLDFSGPTVRVGIKLAGQPTF